MFDYSDLLGKPFKLGSRGPEFYDCWGLCCEIGRRVEITFPEHLTPVEVEAQNEIITKSSQQEFIQLEKPEPFSIITFKLHPPFVDHCGIILPDINYFLHIVFNSSVSKQRVDNRMLIKKIEGFYRLKTNADCNDTESITA